ncbi:hypothetical protein Tco_0951102 [Tanacetum coccineum]|uniref:Uncharacterized protein n=1 Tax=Tanacetum coccineum TaxID=301880 RepID=A0ABQ5DT67_9ASTR
MNHPCDGRAWKYFDMMKPEFSGDARNVRLGLAADGFNPFGMMSQTYSMWPVILTTYNTPPWMCMKETSLMLTMCRSACQLTVENESNLVIHDVRQAVYVGINNSPESTRHLATENKIADNVEMNFPAWSLIKDLARQPRGWKVVEHVYHRDVAESDQDVIHGSSSSNVTLSVELTNFEHTDLSINSESTEVDAQWNYGVRISQITRWGCRCSGVFQHLDCGIRSLKQIDISMNGLQGEIPGDGLGNLTQLVHLDMSLNRFNG